MVQIESKSFNVIVVGCGGTGSQFLPSFLQLASNTRNIKNITLIDGDKFENKNTINQKCLKSDAGLSKALGLASRFNHIYDMHILAYSRYLRTEEELMTIANNGLYNEGLIIVGCVDNNSTRKLISNACTRLSDRFKEVIYIDSGNGDIDRIGQVVTGYRKDGEVVLLDVCDIFPKVSEPDEDLKTINSCTRLASDHPQNISTNVFCAAILFASITNIVVFNKIENNITYANVEKLTMSSR